VTDQTPALPDVFSRWFSGRGWALRQHQAAMLDAAERGVDALLVAPTGAGKTLAGFLPSLVDLSRARPNSPRLHTLYISPLKALAQDVARNLLGPIEEMKLPITAETRTGDTPQSKRQRQRSRPPDMLLTTPEQLALLLASDQTRSFFEDLSAIIIDEAHALAPSKRGDLLNLGMATLRSFAPRARVVGLSATVEDPPALAAWLGTSKRRADIVEAPDTAAAPQVDILISGERIPWAGHMGRFAFAEVYEKIAAAKMTLVFVNTRSQAELTFQELWRLNDQGLAIALHHGSLDVEQRRRVEAAMAAGKLRAIVCTATLDLGIDWGDVDLVIQMGAPKGASRLVQRIGRANHRLDEPSRALLVPTNRFEVLECRAAQDAVEAGAQDGALNRTGSLDVLAQHIMGRAVGEMWTMDALFAEVSSASAYSGLTYETFERVVDFVATGGYALRAYDRHKRIIRDREGKWRVRNPTIAQEHRMNVGAIIDSESIELRVVSSMKGKPGARGGRTLGRVEEWFIEQLRPRDTFMFAGEILRFEAMEGLVGIVTRSDAKNAMVPTWNGGKFPLSTYLARRVREMIHDPSAWHKLPEQVREWLEMQRLRSILPRPDHMLIETFPRGGKHYLVAFPFDGRLAHQTLGMLLTRRLERQGFKPLGFVCNDYAIAVWCLEPMSGIDFNALFDEDMLGDDLDAWLDESSLMKRTFRHCAVIAGLLPRRQPGHEKTGRQVTFSTDLIYDVLRTHEPGHLLLEAARADAAEGFLDIRRLGDLLARVKGRLDHIDLKRVSPLAVPVMLEIGKEAIRGGSADDAILDDAATDLVTEAMGG
jgi:ATP-dependent helicase Lhr and Lhr-like helicase